MALEITAIRIGNYVDYETIPYVVDSITASGRLVVTAVNHDWRPEPCGSPDLEGIPIDDFEHQRVKVISKNKQLRYNTHTGRLYFETNRYLEGTPWPVRFVHQYQNACNDMGWKVDVKL